MLAKYRTLGLFVGIPKELGPNKLITATKKDPVENSLIINKESLEGDKVANLKYHGGPDRVIHHYSLEQYEYLKSIFPEHKDLFIPGSYGENLTTDKLTEKDLCIGDIFKLGSAKLQLTEGRKPCGTIDLTYGLKGVLKEILLSGRYGWFYKVLEEGEAKLDDDLIFLERPYPRLSLQKSIVELFQNKDKDLIFLKEVYECPALSSRWKDYIKKELEK
jgi:MOSC domain-containing protein YiiM